MRASAILLVLALGGVRAAADDEKAGIAFFEQKIRPVLVTHCEPCHGPDAEEPAGNLRLDSKAGWERGGDGGAAVIVPGRPGESLLVSLIRHAEEGREMPPEGDKLSDAVIADIVTWIAMGAPDPRLDGTVEVQRADKTWWSLQPLKRVEPPPSDDSPGRPRAWQANPVDRFLLQAMKRHDLEPSPPADARTLVRRMTYDMHGLPPTIEEVETFAAEHSRDADTAVARLADRLLASPRYGEKWGRHWLDVVRFGESRGFERNLVIDDLWPFRDYVIRSLNDDKPFDRFIVEHLAGDVVGKDRPDIEVATAFLVSGPFDDVENQDAAARAAIRAATLDDIVTATGSAFLGLTINCARCHHHKFDPIPTEDYYRLRAAFEGVVHDSRVVVSRDERARHDALEEDLQRRIRNLESRRGNLESRRGNLESRRGNLESRRGKLEERRTREPPTAATQEEFAALDRELADLRDRLAKVPPLPRVWAGVFRQPGEPTRVQRGGDPTKPADPVAPSSPSVLDRVTAPYALPLDAPEAERRLRLAEWIVAPDNPLTPRVLANRVWHYHFGTGIVDTPGDFGYLGGRPTHPELLDFLAGFLSQAQGQGGAGWRLKPLHRLILTSQAYRQSSAHRDEAARIDKDARFLWRFPPRRVTGEEIRDTLLTVAGVLRLEPMGGPGFRLYEYTRNNVSTYTPLDTHGPETYRRAVYHQSARASVVDVLGDFDFPDIAFAAPRRGTTTSPLQALTMLNHRFVLDMARACAARVAASGRPIEQTYRIAYQREPTPDELNRARTFVAAHGLEAFCRAVLNSSELLTID